MTHAKTCPTCGRCAGTDLARLTAVCEAARRLVNDTKVRTRLYPPSKEAIHALIDAVEAMERAEAGNATA